MKTDYEIGEYGRVHLEFIKMHRKGTYTTLLTEGHLNEHVHNIDEQARGQIDLLVKQMVARIDVNEEPKATAPICWVKVMNNIKESAEEIVLKEVIL